MNSKLLLRLYVTGRTPRSQRAITAVRELCQQELQGACDVEIIDVLEQPHLAEAEKVMATPTLIKRVPPPPRRIIGDLSDRQKVIDGLDLPVMQNDLERKQESR